MTDAVYAWRDLRFSVPPGLDDETLLSFKAAGGGSAFSLTVARDSLGGAAVDAWARTQEQAMAQQKLPAYSADGPRALEGAAHAAALVIDRSFADDSGQKLFQRQCFVPLGKTVAIVTATARDKAAENAKKAAVDVVNSLRLAEK